MKKRKKNNDNSSKFNFINSRQISLKFCKKKNF